MIKKILIVIISFFAATVKADTASTTFTVSATVSNACTISASDLSFGSYQPLSGSAVDATTSISVNCTLDTSYNVGLDAGSGSGASVSTRKLTSGSDLMNYTLYRDSNRTNVWGNTVGTDTSSGTGTGSSQSLTVYGRVIAGQSTVPSGSYSDTINVTITF